MIVVVIVDQVFSIARIVLNISLQPFCQRKAPVKLDARGEPGA